MTTKAYSYVRFSTPEQLQGDSFRRQTEAAQRYAKRHGLALQKFNFHDLGVSAYRGDNVRSGALKAFLDAVDKGVIPEGSYLLVESLDRISREEILEALALFIQIISAGITLVTLIDGRSQSKESINRNPMELNWSLMLMMRANEESATKSRRGKATWEAKRAKAGERRLTRVCPGWLRFNRETDEFEVIEDRADVVRRIFALLLDGIGQNAIAATLNREGVSVFGRGKRWHRTYIAKLLRDGKVIGTLVPHTVEYENDRRVRKPQEPKLDYYPAILDVDTYQRVQAMCLHTSSPGRGQHAGAPVQNILGGLGRCPTCGGTVTRVRKGKNGAHFLVCAKAKSAAGCVYRTVPLQIVERAIIERAEELTAEAPAGDAEIDDEIENLEGVIDGHEIGLETLLDTLQSGNGGDRSPAIIKRITKAEGELEALRASRADLLDLRSASSGPFVDRRLSDLRAALMTTDELDRGLVNRLLRQLLRGVVVDGKSGRMILQWQHGGETAIQFAWPKEDRDRANA